MAPIQKDRLASQAGEWETIQRTVDDRYIALQINETSGSCHNKQGIKRARLISNKVRSLLIIPSLPLPDLARDAAIFREATIRHSML
jgi:hypothetical protein